jgi:chemotaxis protein histidine kinase CheA
VPGDDFSGRLAAVRRRFAAGLADKIAATRAAIPTLTADHAGAAAAVGESYRRIHGISGVGASVGFVTTGEAARAVEAVLLPPFRAGRGLTVNEITRLEQLLAALSSAAQAELQTPPNNQG